jgi:hypothetical protein
MRLHNRHGDPVDPVPFAVVAGVGVLLCISFGPLYLNALGVDFAVGVPLSLLAAVAVCVAAYYRFVWTTDPFLLRERPADARFRRLWYGGLLLLALFVLLSLPLL